MRLILFSLLTLLFCAPAQARGEDLGAVPDPVREDLLGGRWDQAISKLDDLGTRKPEHGDLWLLLTGVAHDRAGRVEKALGALRRLESEHRESPWVPKARFRRAEILRAQGRYKEAETIYEAAVFQLRSPERQGELANVYLEYADDAFISPLPPPPLLKGKLVFN